jgi:RND superfamily putative drug exporter
VLLDATIVRMIIVPAVMTLFGRAAWWLPRWLDRQVPNVDIEGEHLLARLTATPAASPNALDIELAELVDTESASIR